MTAQRPFTATKTEVTGGIVTIIPVVGLTQSQPTTGESTMGKGNNAVKNDKKTAKPKQLKAKPAAKK